MPSANFATLTLFSPSCAIIHRKVTPLSRKTAILTNKATHRGMKYDVFISYSRKDYMDDRMNVIPGNVVSKVKEALTNEGITYWFDEEGLYSGNDFTEKIVSNIEASTIFLFLSTKDANASPWTSKEVACADEIYKILPRCREANGEARS